MVRVSRANAKVRLRICRREAEATLAVGTADRADPAGMTIFLALRACFALRCRSSARTISSKDRTCSGSDPVREPSGCVAQLETPSDLKPGLQLCANSCHSSPLVSHCGLSPGRATYGPM